MKAIGITGGTGFIGHHLARQLQRTGNQVYIFTRKPEKKKKSRNLRYAYWNPKENKIDLNALREIHTMVHLAGAGIADKRWTARRKKEIVESRVKGTDFLVSQLRAYAPACTTLIAASAIGYYGPDRSSSPFIEESPPYNDFLAKTCVQWEKASLAASDFLRTVIFRFGHVLGKDGGAFPKLAAPTSFGLVPIIGTGRQVMSWIHIDDHIRMLHAAITSERYSGVYNAVAPNPVSYTDLMKAIARAKGGLKMTAHIPTFVLKLLLGEVSDELCKSTNASAQKIIGQGFRFQYPTIDAAVAQLLSRDQA